jgi:hypothetical protein
MATTAYSNVIRITTTGQAYTGSGKLERIILYSSTTGAFTATIYDDTSAGTDDQLVSVLVLDSPDVSGEATATRVFEIGAHFTNGLSVVISGTGEASLVLER